MRRVSIVVGLLILAAFSATIASAGPIQAGWTCQGACGTLGADGSVPLSPMSSGFYSYVSTNGGIGGLKGENWGTAALPTGNLGHESNGSVLISPSFTANSGDLLNFYFDYITSDGSGWADYGWAALMDPTTNSAAALLFTARTVPAPNNIVPGQGMPLPTANMNPSTIAIQPGTSWSPLGFYSGHCFASGCGNSGWVNSQFTIPTSGVYDLEFGVTNWGDTAYDSGMAIDGVTVGGHPIATEATPEPSSFLLLLTGLASAGQMIRRKIRI